MMIHGKEWRSFLSEMKGEIAVDKWALRLVCGRPFLARGKRNEARNISQAKC